MTDTSRLINLTDEYQTRDGRKVEVISTKVANATHPVAAWVEDDDGEVWVRQFRANGRITSFQEAPGDLVPVHKKRVRWVNFYLPEEKLEKTQIFVPAHESKEVADKRRGPNCIATVRVEFEEGEGLGDD